MSHINQATGAIIGAAIEVHRALGPGLLESTYQACLVHELRQRGWRVESQGFSSIAVTGSIFSSRTPSSSS